MYDALIYSGVTLGLISVVLAVIGVFARKKIKSTNVGMMVTFSFIACMGMSVCVLMTVSHDVLSENWSTLLDTVQAWTTVVAGVSAVSAILNGISIFSIAKRS